MLKMLKWGVWGTLVWSCPGAIWKDTYSNIWSSRERPGLEILGQICKDQKGVGREWENMKDYTVISPYLSKRPIGMIKLQQWIWRYWETMKGYTKMKTWNQEKQSGLKEWIEQQTRLRSQKQPCCEPGWGDDTDKACCKVSRKQFPSRSYSSCKMSEQIISLRDYCSPGQCRPLTRFAMSYPLKITGDTFANLPLVPDSTQSQINPCLLLIQPQKKKAIKNWSLLPWPLLRTSQHQPWPQKRLEPPSLYGFNQSDFVGLQVCVWLPVADQTFTLPLLKKKFNGSPVSLTCHT